MEHKWGINGTQMDLAFGSSRECITRFKYDGVFWGKLLEYDYEQLMTVADETVNKFYLNQLAAI